MQGFEAVVYLAPPTVQDAVQSEPLVVARQGLVYVNIPIAFDDPTERDFDTFAAVMKALAGRENPAAAWKDVERIWTPRGPWKRLIEEQLRKHGVTFELF